MTTHVKIMNMFSNSKEVNYHWWSYEYRFR